MDYSQAWQRIVDESGLADLASEIHDHDLLDGLGHPPICHSAAHSQSSAGEMGSQHGRKLTSCSRVSARSLGSSS